MSIKSNQEYTKLRIRQRMAKNISRIWDVDEPDNLDPLVNLLTEAMAEEIFGLSGELEQANDRVLARQVATLTPAQYLVARPSHSLMRAYPTYTSLYVDTDAVFYANNAKEIKRYNLSRIEFSPIMPVTLFKGEVKYLSICGEIYKYAADFRRSTVAIPNRRSNALNRAIWIGIDTDKGIESLNNLSLYFDFIHAEDKFNYLKLLSCAKWSMDGKTVDVEYGMRPKNEDENESNHKFLESPLDFIMSDLRSIYDIHYVTVRAHPDIKENFPKELQEVYDDDTISRYTTPLYWFKLVFPPGVTRDILDSLKVSMNIFPIVNISRKTVSQAMANIPLYLSLETSANEFFMEVKSVLDSSGMQYKPVYSDGYRAGDTGYYALRKGGVERYSNANDARSTMTRMNNILRDHTLFSNSRKDEELNNIVSEAHAAVNKIADDLYDVDKEPQYKSYIAIDKSNKGETLYADYLTTNGAVINRFDPNENLNSNLGSDIDKTKSIIAYPLRGGENEPSEDKARDRFRYILTSRDSIFSRHDIKDYCFSEYGDKISSVEIMTGRRISKKEKEGIQKTLDLHIKLKNGLDRLFEPEEFKTNLLCKLESRSPDNYIYQIFID